MKYYAVKRGLVPGIYKSWAQTEPLVKGFPGAKYKSFSTLKAAQNWLYENKTPVVCDVKAYTDGSYNEKNQRSGYAAVIVNKAGNVETVLSGQKKSDTRQVAGELAAVMSALEYVKRAGYSSVEICYDYRGVELWANGEWKAKTKVSAEYVKFINRFSQSVKIVFRKVDAHTGDRFNEQADRFAKHACGM